MKRKVKYDYFEEFVKNSNYALEEAKLLKGVMDHFSIQEIDDNRKKIHHIENEADDKEHDMKNYLLRDFLPPIEREDILSIAHKIDDITDNIDEIIINMDILNITQIKPCISNFTKLLLECCENVTDLLEEFKNLKKVDSIKEKVMKINHLEDEGDRLYQNEMKELYQNETEVIDIIRWSKILECFEECFDACESLAGQVEQVITKNA